MLKTILNTTAYTACGGFAALAVYLFAETLARSAEPSGITAFMLSMMAGAASITAYAAVRD